MRIFIRVATLTLIISSLMLAAHETNFLGFGDMSINNEAMRAGLVIFTLFGPFISWPVVATALVSRMYCIPKAWISLPFQYLGIIGFELIAFMVLPWAMVRSLFDTTVGDTHRQATTDIPDVVFLSIFLLTPVAVLFLTRAMSHRMKA